MCEGQRRIGSLLEAALAGVDLAVELGSLFGHARKRAECRRFQALFCHLNASLFAAELPHVILRFERDKTRSGSFLPGSWCWPHEISLDVWQDRSAKDVGATLAHEMVHLWDHAQGSAPFRVGYHGRSWRDKMEAIGLLPVACAGSKIHMDHEIVRGGAFDRLWRASGARLPARSARKVGVGE